VLSAIATEHVQRPRNNGGPLEGASAVGRFGSEGGGPYLTIWLRVEGNTIVSAAYETYGCPAAIACGSMATELIKGRTLEQARLLEPDDLITVLGGLPEGKGECAQMAIVALRDALDKIGDTENAV